MAFKRWFNDKFWNEGLSTGMGPFFYELCGHRWCLRLSSCGHRCVKHQAIVEITTIDRSLKCHDL
jgi:hypothetical protein